MPDEADSQTVVTGARCSFCDRPRSQVAHLISGVGSFICGGCIARIRGLMGARELDPPEAFVVRTTQTAALPLAVSERDHRATLADAFPSMVAQGLATPDQHGEHLSQVYGVAHVDLETAAIDPKVAALVPAELARRHNLIPFALAGDRVRVAMRDPLDEEAILAVQALVGGPVEVLVATPRGLAHAIARSIPPRPPAPGASCSFCGKRENEGLAVVTEGQASICEECISLGEDILAAENDSAP